MSTNRISIKTPVQCGFIDITAQVKRILVSDNFKSGICTVFVPHTTAGICINEAADPDAASDILKHLERAVPQNHSSYQHAEGNSAAHIKSVITGSSVSIPVEDGRLLLGTWQGIYLCEFDGPRTRSVLITAV